jgi:hypothetical protein
VKISTWSRRRLGALLLAAAVIAGVVVVLAVMQARKAEAFCPFPPPPGCGGAPPEPPPLPWPWPAPPTPGPWLPPPAPGGGGGGQTPGNSEMVKKASEKTKAALDNKDCNKFISGDQPDGNDARSRWGSNTILERRTEVYVNKKGEADPSVAASVNGTNTGTGGGTINLWRRFFDEASIVLGLKAEAKRQNPALYDKIKDWTPDQFRTLIMLHEAAHLAGTLPEDHTGDWEPNDQTGYHLKLVNACPIPP